RYENQPYGSILIEVLKRAYTVHPYKWPTIGFMEDLNAASEKDYKDFYETYYVPNNAVLVVAGDVDPKEARRLVEAYFGPIARGRDLTRRQVEEPVLKGEVRDVVYDNIQLPAVVQAYRIPAYGTPDFYAVDMVNRLLSSGNSSRLQKALKDEQQKALYVGAFSFPFEDPGLAIAFAIANAGVDAQALEEAMDAEVLRLQQDLVQEEELAKLKAQLETEQVMDNARIAGVASKLASAYTFLGDASAASTEIERYLAITPKDIQRAATTYFNRDSRVVLHYLPKSQKN
nr:pitrilysin family protein [Flavobacteriales bacterium]